MPGCHRGVPEKAEVRAACLALIGWLLSSCYSGQILWLCLLGLEGWEMPVLSQGRPVYFIANLSPVCVCVSGVAGVGGGSEGGTTAPPVVFKKPLFSLAVHLLGRFPLSPTLHTICS